MPPPRNVTFKDITIATCNGFASRLLVDYISSSNHNYPRMSRDEIDKLINKTPYSAWLSTESLARFWPANGVVGQTSISTLGGFAFAETRTVQTEAPVSVWLRVQAQASA